MSKLKLPSGTVTLLFTDIEGSTRLIGELGEEGYVQALMEHRRLVRSAFASHGGVEVETQGDAFLYAFPDPAEALAAAAQSQQALASGPVKVRMGLHTAEPRLTGEGYSGRELHRAARIAACGHGGQVVVSAATCALVEDELTELGEHRLKDFDDPVALFQLGQEHFPPLKTISNTNLPRPASSFVGRQEERDEVVNMLRNGTRIVTLSGPGGSGKTRLALEAAAELVPTFMAGVFWVGLAALREPALVTETIAQSLGAREGLAEHIAERDLLLLLDNFEQVVEAAAELGPLLERCPNLKLMVTSRELLRINGEVEYPVPPLSEPEAVELFCDRARLEPDETIAELCRRLDDLPLALELAAARASVLSPAQVLGRLSQRLDLLKGGRDADPRQQTLRATIAWSHDLLDDEERGLFARLAVFSGGCTLEAAESVADADLDALQSLVEKSLLRHTKERFWLLETIREFALERLAESGAEAEVRSRHAAYFVRFAEQAALQNADGGSFAEPFARIGVEHDNLRSTLEWARDSDEHEVLLRVAAALADYWKVRSLVHEQRTWLALALERGATPLLARVRVLRVAGVRALNDGDLAHAEALNAEHRALAEEVGDEEELHLAMNSSAHLARAKGDLEGARGRFLELAEAAASFADRQLHAYAVINVGLVELDVGNYRAALEYSTAAVDMLSELGDETGLAAALGNCGWSALCLADPARAADYFRRSLVYAGQVEATHQIATVALGLGAALIADRDEQRGAELLGAAASLRDELDTTLNDVLEEQIHEQAVVEARAALGEDVFDAAWARGRAIKPQELVNFCEPGG
jgi:predicted ATPase